LSFNSSISCVRKLPKAHVWVGALVAQNLFVPRERGMALVGRTQT